MLRPLMLRIIIACHLFLFFTASAGVHIYPKANFVSRDEPKKSTGTSYPLNHHARKFTEKYLPENKEILSKIRKDHKATFRMMENVLKKYRLPIELKYLAVVESELKTSAESNVGAMGIWQLMPETSRQLGLQVTDQFDERTNNYKSTKAASLYLRDLYREFNDWLLAVAAYNCGPGPVYTAINKSGSRDFWELQYYLPKESRGHVKKYIATHFYFEGKGGITTHTREELIALR
jgi:membrane-bound lytic murein transglycosylase D